MLNVRSSSVTRGPYRFATACALLILAAVLAVAGCGDGGSSSAGPSPSEPTAAETTDEIVEDGGQEPPPEPEVPKPPGLEPPFALEIGDVALVLGGDLLCRVAEDGVSCAEAGEDGPKSGRYAINVNGGDLRVTFVAADGEVETVFFDTHADPSSDLPIEPAEPQETVILEEGDAVSVSGTDIVCVAGEIGFIGCSRLNEEGGLRSRTLAVGLDSAGVSVARIEVDGTLVEVFSRTYDG